MKTRLLRNLSATALMSLFTFCLPDILSAETSTPIFINEIHYDNDGLDTGEFVEIAGPAGTDLTGWSIVFYNGANQSSYGTEALTGTIPDLGHQMGMVSVNYEEIQNGAPDGLALVDPDDKVVQFLSYEGTFTASGGPADGMSSSDIGVFENGETPIGFSLQLAGRGKVYEDFTWTGPVAATQNARNSRQSFGSGSNPAIFLLLH